MSPIQCQIPGCNYSTQSNAGDVAARSLINIHLSKVHAISSALPTFNSSSPADQTQSSNQLCGHAPTPEPLNDHTLPCTCPPNYGYPPPCPPNYGYSPPCHPNFGYPPPFPPNSGYPSPSLPLSGYLSPQVPSNGQTPSQPVVNVIGCTINTSNAIVSQDHVKAANLASPVLKMPHIKELEDKELKAAEPPGKKLKNRIRLVLLGITGEGKSSFGNYILNEERVQTFKVGSNIKSCTFQVNMGTGHLSGHSDTPITIIDTPGLDDSEGRDTEHLNLIVEQLQKLGYIDGFILVLKKFGRFTSSLYDMFKTFELCFGSDMWEHMFFKVIDNQNENAWKIKLATDFPNCTDLNLKTFLFDCNFEPNSEELASFNKFINQLIPFDCSSIENIKSERDRLRQLFTQQRNALDELISQLRDIRTENRTLENKLNPNKLLDDPKESTEVIIMQKDFLETDLTTEGRDVVQAKGGLKKKNSFRVKLSKNDVMEEGFAMNDSSDTQHSKFQQKSFTEVSIFGKDTGDLTDAMYATDVKADDHTHTAPKVEDTNNIKDTINVLKETLNPYKLLDSLTKSAKAMFGGKDSLGTDVTTETEGTHLVHIKEDLAKKDNVPLKISQKEIIEQDPRKKDSNDGKQSNIQQKDFIEVNMLNKDAGDATTAISTTDIKTSYNTHTETKVKDINNVKDTIVKNVADVTDAKHDLDTPTNSEDNTPTTTVPFDNFDNMIVEKTLIYLGKTGEGKSSLANFMVESNSNDKFEVGNDIESCTEVVQQRKGHLKEHKNISLLLIDTPGLDDSKRRDSEHIQLIVECLNDVGTVNAFILVMESFSTFRTSMFDMLKTFEMSFGYSFWKHLMINVRTTKNNESWKKMLSTKFPNSNAEHIPVTDFDCYYNPNVEQEAKEMSTKLDLFSQKVRNYDLFDCSGIDAIKTERDQVKEDLEKQVILIQELNNEVEKARIIKLKMEMQMEGKEDLLKSIEVGKTVKRVLANDRIGALKCNAKPSREPSGGYHGGRGSGASQSGSLNGPSVLKTAKSDLAPWSPPAGLTPVHLSSRPPIHPQLKSAPPLIPGETTTRQHSYTATLKQVRNPPSRASKSFNTGHSPATMRMGVQGRSPSPNRSSQDDIQIQYQHFTAPPPPPIPTISQTQLIGSSSLRQGCGPPPSPPVGKRPSHPPPPPPSHTPPPPSRALPPPPPQQGGREPPTPPTRRESINRTNSSSHGSPGESFKTRFSCKFKPIEHLPPPEPFSRCTKSYPSKYTFRSRQGNQMKRTHSRPAPPTPPPNGKIPILPSQSNPIYNL